jgi:nitrite reductase/ring-hydroxylating ferredoxin subunit/uncharacterized membrane protein
MATIAHSPKLHAAAESLGRLEELDGVAQPLAKKVRETIPKGTVKDALSGVPLGHALHPLLTQLVVGTWTSATLLDLVGGRSAAAGTRKLIAAGIAAALPTTLTGLNDWADSEAADDEVRRVGAVHGALNAAGLTLYAASLAARRRTGDRGGVAGVALSLAGLAALGASGHLGGHLAYAKGVGVDQTAWAAELGDWTDVAAEGDLPAVGGTLRVDVQDTPILLARDAGGTLHALADRCSHRGGSLADGEIDGGCVECPLHGSRFALSDGSVVRGPSAYPQPAYDVRTMAGRVQIRSR